MQSHQGCEGVSSPKLMVVCINVWLLHNVTRTLVTLCKKEDFSVNECWNLIGGRDPYFQSSGHPRQLQSRMDN